MKYAILICITIIGFLLRIWPIDYFANSNVLTPGQFQANLYPSLWSSLAILLLYLLVVRTLTLYPLKNINPDWVGIVAALLLSLNPWHVVLGKSALAPSAFITLIIAGLYLYQMSLRWFSYLLLLIALLVYPPAAILPILIILALSILQKPSFYLLYLLIFLIAFAIIPVWGKRYLNFFSPELLFYSGNTILETKNFLRLSLFNLLDAPLIFLGLLSLFQSNHPFLKKTVFSLLIIAPLPAVVLVGDYPLAQASALIIPLIIFSALGIMYIYRRFPLLLIPLIFFYTIMTLLNRDLYFFHQYTIFDLSFHEPSLSLFQLLTKLPTP